MSKGISSSYEQLLSSLNVEENDAVFIINPETGQFLDVNEKSCQNLGYTKQELLSMRVRDIEAVIPTDYSWKKQAQAIKEKKIMVIIGKHKRKDGSDFLVEVNAHQVSQGGKEYIVALVRVVE